MSELTETDVKTIIYTVKTCMCQILGCDIDDIKDESDLYYDLGMDSLDAVEIIMDIESKLNIAISDESIDNVKTFREAYESVCKCYSKSDVLGTEEKLEGFKNSSSINISSLNSNDIDIDIISKNIANNPKDFTSSDIKRCIETYAYNKLQNYISSNKYRSKETERDLKFIRKALKLAIKELDCKNKIIDRKIDRKLIKAKSLIEDIL